MAKGQHFQGNKKPIWIGVSVAILLVVAVSASIFAVFGKNWSDHGELPNSGVASVESGTGEMVNGEEPSEESADLNAPVEEQPGFNKPDEMKAAYLIPGVDFLTDENPTPDVVKKEIDQAFEEAKEYTLNTMVIGLTKGDRVIYTSEEFPSVIEGFDILNYILQKCNENSFYSYVLYDVLNDYQEGKIVSHSEVDSAFLTELSKRSSIFAGQYRVDGVVLQNFEEEDSAAMYAHYMSSMAGSGYDPYMLSLTENSLTAVRDGIRSTNSNIQVGVLCSAVWANASSAEGGSDTSSNYQMLTDGNADAKAYVEKGMFDFLFVEAFGSQTDSAEPFDTVVDWWYKLTEGKNLPTYFVQAASKATSNVKGWSSPDQLARQLTVLKKYSFQYAGTVFDSLKSLLDNPKGSSNAVLQLFTNQTSADLILKELTMTKPTQNTFTTSEPKVTFTGASDPNFPLTFNGEEIQTDASGYFNIEVDLQNGLNTFTFVHKEKTVTYNITRNVVVLQSISPLGTAKLEGGMKLEITANAYRGASVYAMINGTRINMTANDFEDDSTDRDSAYVKYSGNFTAPGATASVQNLGNVVVYASYEGVTQQKTGALVQINRKAELAGGQTVKVTATSAETFPSDVINDLASAQCYPLPKGTLDKISGDMLSYSENGTTYYYYMLASGIRVYAKDVTQVSDEIPTTNTIYGLQISADGSYTYASLNMEWNVPYKVTIDTSGMYIDFAYTTQTPENMTLTQNPLFSSATWSGSTLKLTFRTAGGFLGYKAYYQNDLLTFRFTNPAPMQSSGGGYRLSGAKIVLDPGHGGSDPGATGNNPSYPEAVLTRIYAGLVRDKLQAMGAAVTLIDTTSYKPSLEERVQIGKSVSPHLFLSIHMNSYVNSGPSGTESYYFYGFQKIIGSKLTSAIAATGWGNRGVKYGAYYVTRDSELPSNLLEVGFVSTTSEYEKLLNPSYQETIANGIVNGIVDYFIATGSLNSQPTGTQTAGTMSGSGGEDVIVEQESQQSTVQSVIQSNTFALSSAPKEETNSLSGFEESAAAANNLSFEKERFLQEET